MKKASFILIGLLLTVLLSSHFLVFKITQLSHQNQFRSYITQHLDQLKKIEIYPSQLYTNTKEISWKDGNKEIVTGNMIYDIIAIVNTGKTVSLFVVGDDDEKTLTDKYVQLSDGIYDQSGPEKPNVIKDFLSLKFFSNQSTQITPLFSDHAYPSSHTKEILPEVHSTIEVPPPAFFA